MDKDGNRVSKNGVTNPAYIGATRNPTNESDFSQMNSLTTLDIEYGYKIKFIATQTPGFRINGEILGDVYTDYSGGVFNRYYLDYVTFEITEKGLKAKYNDPEIRDNDNLFTIVDGGGLNPFRIKLTPTTNGNNAIGTLTVTKNHKEILYDDSNSDKKVLKISLIRGNPNNSIQDIKKEFTKACRCWGKWYKS